MHLCIKLSFPTHKPQDGFMLLNDPRGMLSSSDSVKWKQQKKQCWSLRPTGPLGKGTRQNRQYQAPERRLAYQRAVMEVLVQYDLCNQIYDISYPLRQPVNSYVHRIYLSQKKNS